MKMKKIFLKKIILMLDSILCGWHIISAGCRKRQIQPILCRTSTQSCRVPSFFRKCQATETSVRFGNLAFLFLAKKTGRDDEYRAF
jgi:hypothetical protein